MLKLDVMLSSI